MGKACERRAARAARAARRRAARRLAWGCRGATPQEWCRRRPPEARAEAGCGVAWRSHMLR
eukprot:4845579-Prymnesium_polylepis.1